MRLYLNARSKNNIGYVPDWLKVCYKENGQELELALDIQGEISYEKNGLDCRCKGDLVPWTLFNMENGEEINYDEMSEEEVDKLLPIKKIADILQTGTDFRIGIYPADCSHCNVWESAKEDVLSDCKGTCMLYDGENEYEINFVFEAELNE